MGGLANADVIRGDRSMLTGEEEGKICQNLATSYVISVGGVSDLRSGCRLVPNRFYKMNLK